ncbi:hypothetical protein MCEMSEM23_02795 [Rhabdaerophilaceae bacterium]
MGSADGAAISCHRNLLGLIWSAYFEKYQSRAPTRNAPNINTLELIGRLFDCRRDGHNVDQKRLEAHAGNFTSSNSSAKAKAVTKPWASHKSQPL